MLGKSNNADKEGDMFNEITAGVESPFLCGSCGQTFSSRQELNEHQHRSH